MDVFLVIKVALWLVWLTGLTVALSHIFQRTSWLPSWLRWYWIRRNAEDPRREGWAELFIFAGLGVPGLVYYSGVNLGFDATYAVCFALLFVGLIIHGWPQVRRFLHRIHAKRQQG